MKKKKDSILFATIMVSALAIIGKILGFGREALIAAFYGATKETDAFFFAQSMPSMIFPAVGNSLALAFTSAYVKNTEVHGELEGDKYASRMLTGSILLGILLGFVGILVAPILVPVFAPGFKGEQLSLAIKLTRLTMGSFVLIILHYMLGAVLNSKRLFIGSQVAALFYNITIIVITAVAGKNQSMSFLTITVILGTIVQVIGLIICCRGHFKFYGFLSPFHDDTIQLGKLALPILLGNSVVQLNNIVDKALASTLEGGALSALSYANSLNALVISVFVTSLSTVLYPTLTSDAAAGNLKKYSETLLKSLCSLTLILIPVCCITFISATDIVKVVFERGNFDNKAVEATALVLVCYAPRFLFIGVREVLTRGCFALQDTKTPARNSAIGVVCNIVFSIIFVRLIGIMGIALGTSLSALVSAILLLIHSHNNESGIRIKDFMRIILPQLISGTFLVISLSLLQNSLSGINSLFRFAVNTILGMIIYVGVLFVIDREQINSIKKTLFNRR